MTKTTNALRLVAAGALGLPLTLGVAGVAQAHTPQAPTPQGGDCAPTGPTGTRAVQGGSLVDALGQVNPTANVGGILNSGPVEQVAYSEQRANSGILGGSGRAVQGGSLVAALAQVNPVANVGGILSGGRVTQVAYNGDQANSGIAGTPAHHDVSGGRESFQASDLVSGLVQVNPTANVGGIASSGPVEQTAYSEQAANSGIVTGGGHGPGTAAQGGSLLGLNLQVSPTLNIGGILSGGPVTQEASSHSASNSGIL